MRKTMLVLLMAGGLAGIHATDSRVIAMGRHDDFFTDETSVLRNPADACLYPSLVQGSLGSYRVFSGDSGQVVRDPVDPWFGATLVLPFSPDSAEQTTRFAFGALFNRHDALLDYLTPKNARYVGDTANHLPNPAGRIDLLASLGLKDGPMLGIGVYLASQSYMSGTVIDSETSVYKLNAGINWPLGPDSRLEMSASGGVLRAKGDSAGAGRRSILVAYDDRFYGADARFFWGISGIHGSLVPQFHYREVNLYQKRVKLTDISAGLGYNRPFEHGLFWTGLQFVSTSGSYFEDSTRTGKGGKFSFGFETAVWGNWLLLRGGGQKVLLYQSVHKNGKPDRKHWYENAAADGSDTDCLGLGLGITPTKRSRIDFVLSEDAPFTFANLLGGSERYLFSRISAMYGF